MRAEIATLIYCFNEGGEVLLLERLKEPNQGLWSPIGGKMDMDSGESPFQCACRETREEIGITVKPGDFHLAGLVSEKGSSGHWLMFLFEMKPKLRDLPAAHREGRFGFFSREMIGQLSIPETDKEMIWPLFWKHRGGFFSTHCDMTAPRRERWSLEEPCPTTHS